jgi:hypothetical protein
MREIIWNRGQKVPGENMRCANCWEEILEPPPNSPELQIHWIFDESEVCPGCHSILLELELAE